MEGSAGGEEWGGAIRPPPRWHPASGRVILPAQASRSFLGRTRPDCVEPDLKIAAFTMVYNDPVFLPIWHHHYGRAFGADNIFVLDHGSDDGCARDLGAAHVLRVPRDRDFDENHRAIFVSRCQTVLLRHYDAVVFTDADEFLVPDPARFAGLRDFVERRCERVVNAVGLDVVHVPDLEPDIDRARPVLTQRRYVQFLSSYCKPSIARIPLLWDPGFHSCDQPPAIDHDLYLFHLKRMDKQMALARLQTTRALAWSRNALAKGHSQDHRLADAAFVERMFPYSAATVGAHLIDGFDFSADIEQYAARRPHEYTNREGAVAAIPERFRDAIGAAGSGVVPSGGGGVAARRALARLIAVNTLRDRARPSVERIRGWLGM